VAHSSSSCPAATGHWHATAHKLTPLVPPSPSRHDTPVALAARPKMIMIGPHARESTWWSAETGAKYR
jgi:hypothetical protein